MAYAYAFIAIVAVALIQTAVAYMYPSEGPRLQDLKVMASTYGAVIPEPYGTVRTAGNLIWTSPIREVKTKKSAKGGSWYNEYTYFVDMAVCFAQGPVSAVRRMWADGKLIYDVTGQSKGVSSNKYRFRWYLGDEDQLQDPLIAAYEGVDRTPGHRGLCYLVAENFPLQDFGNRIPQFAAEVYVDLDGTGQGNETGQVTTVVYQAGTGIDATQSEFVADLEYGLTYTIGSNDAGTVKGLRRVQWDTGYEDKIVLSSDMGFEPYESILGTVDDSQISYVTATLSTGAIVAQMGGLSNYVPIVLLDPVSFQVIAQWPTTEYLNSHLFFYGFGAGLGEDPIPSNAAGPCAANGSYYGHIGRALGGCGIFYGPSMTLMGFAEIDHPVAITGTGSLNGDFWVLSNEPGETVGLYFADQLGNGLRYTFSYLDFGLEAPPTSMSARSIIYDQSDAGVICTIVVNSQTWLVKYALDSSSTVWTLRLPSGVNGNFGPSRILQGELAFTDGELYYAINTVDGTYIDRDADLYIAVDREDQPPGSYEDGDEGTPLDAPVNSAFQVYDSARRSLAVKGSDETKDAFLQLGLGLMKGTSLGSIVEQLLRRGGLQSKHMDLTPLYDIEVRGYGWAQATDVKNVIDELKRVYLFDLVESNGKIVATMRADGEDDTSIRIPQAVLGSTDMDALDYWKETRISEGDLPELMTLSFMNPDINFETNTQSAKRIANPIPTMYSRQRANVEANLVMTATEAKQQVHKMLYQQWKERTTHGTRLPWAYLHLDPSDIIRVALDDGRTYVERIHQTELGADFTTALETYGRDSGAYESDVEADTGGSGRQQTVQLATPARAFILNTPLLRDTDSSGGSYSRYYTALGSHSQSTYQGATLFQSMNDLDYEALYSEPEQVEWGVVNGRVPPPSHGDFSLDWETEIVITPAVDFFELESITDDELWSGLNLCVVGNEVLQFRDAEENDDGTWTIRNLLRARRGTEYAASAHSIGDAFIFLNNSTVEMQGDLIDARGQARYFKAVGSGLSVNDTPALQINYEPRDLMPYAVAQIQREFLSDGVEITWARRTRLGGNMQDGTGEVALNETYERYEVYLLAEAFDGDLSRGIPPVEFLAFKTVDAPQVSFSTAELEAEAIDVDLDTLNVVIYQLSDAVGRGFPSPRSIEPWRDS